MTIFVYYSDDYYEMGGVGLEEFDDKQSAAKWILERIGQHPNSRSPADYTVISGVYCELTVKERVAALEIEEG